MADHVFVFSGEGANPAADYKVWKKWATAKLITEKGCSKPFGPLLFTYIFGVAAQAFEQVTIEELRMDGGEKKYSMCWTANI